MLTGQSGGATPALKENSRQAILECMSQTCLGTDACASGVICGLSSSVAIRVRQNACDCQDSVVSGVSEL